MKNIFYICLALGFMFSSVAFVSCGSDDEKSNPENTNSDSNGSGGNAKPERVVDRDEAGNIKINAVNFPDAEFLSFVKGKFGADGVLTNDEIASLTSIRVTRWDVGSLQGIEFFTELKTLLCNHNQIKELDLSKNTKLESVDCSYNGMTSLNVSGCKNIIYLYCFSNQLSSLNVSGCTSLRVLHCYRNQINGEGMDALIESLPTAQNGDLWVKYYDDQNEMTKSQVAAATAKGWTPYYESAATYGKVPYAGVDPN